MRLTRAGVPGGDLVLDLGQALAVDLQIQHLPLAAAQQVHAAAHMLLRHLNDRILVWLHLALRPLLENDLHRRDSTGIPGVEALQEAAAGMHQGCRFVTKQLHKIC